MVPWIYPFIIFILSSALLSGLAFYGWRSGLLIARKAFSLLMLSFAIYFFGGAMELIFPGLPGKLFWNNFAYIGIVSVGPCWLALALLYSGKQRFLNKGTILLLFLIPLTTLILKYTDGFFHLVYKTVDIDMQSPFPIVVFTRGYWYWVQIIFTNACALIGSILVIIVFFQSAAIYRKQAGIMLIATLVPWAAFIIYLSFHFLHGVDFIPILLAIDGPLYALGLIRYRLFDSAPLTWKNVLDTITNHMIILNNDGRIVDFNPGSQKLFKELNKKSIGTPFGNIASGFPEIQKLIESPDRFQTDIRIDSPDGTRLLRSQVFYIRDHTDQITGKTIVINDTIVKYKKNYYDRESLTRDFNEIEKIMEKEKLYLNPELTLPGLADQLKIPRNRLSYILNEYRKQKFYDFLNTYRIGEAKRLMTTDLYAGNILRIAFESGFNSKTTFYTAFKKITGTTPLEFLSSLKNKPGRD